MRTIKSIKKNLGSFNIDIDEMELLKGITCILGDIGSGKTEVLKLIAGVNQFEGKVSEISKDCIYSIEPDRLFSIAIKDYIRLYAISFIGFDKDYFEHKLHKFDIDIESNVNSLSLGQQSIISSLLSLSTRKDIILIDEPFNNLDPMNRKELRDCFIDAVEDNKIVVLASNNIEEVERIADNIILLNNGSVLARESIDSIDNLKSWYKSKIIDL